MRRRHDENVREYLMMGLCGLAALLTIALVMGWALHQDCVQGKYKSYFFGSLWDVGSLCRDIGYPVR